MSAWDKKKRQEELKKRDKERAKALKKKLDAQKAASFRNSGFVRTKDSNW